MHCGIAGGRYACSRCASGPRRWYTGPETDWLPRSRAADTVPRVQRARPGRSGSRALQSGGKWSAADGRIVGLPPAGLAARGRGEIGNRANLLCSYTFFCFWFCLCLYYVHGRTSSSPASSTSSILHLHLLEDVYNIICIFM